MVTPACVYEMRRASRYCWPVRPVGVPSYLSRSLEQSSTIDHVRLPGPRSTYDSPLSARTVALRTLGCFMRYVPGFTKYPVPSIITSQSCPMIAMSLLLYVWSPPSHGMLSEASGGLLRCTRRTYASLHSA